MLSCYLSTEKCSKQVLKFDEDIGWVFPVSLRCLAHMDCNRRRIEPMVTIRIPTANRA
jgi:hypothetical protein